MKIKCGLILEGGAMRGMFTCGVLDVFMEEGITFDGAIGISAGAVFGCNFKSAKIGRPIRYNKKYCRDKRYCSIRSLLKTGDLYGEDFCYRELPDVLDPFDRVAFKNNPMEFYIGATDVYSGNTRYHLCSDGGSRDMKWMQASASMPLVSRPVSVDGYLMLDGGITDAVPYAYMKGIGYNRNVLILTQPKGYRKRENYPGWALKCLFHKFPAIEKAMADRSAMYNRQMDEIDQMEEDGTSFVIRPKEKLGVGRVTHDPDQLECAYQMGRSVASECVGLVKAFLNSGGRASHNNASYHRT